MALPAQSAAPDSLITYYLQITDRSQFSPAYLEEDASGVMVLTMHQPDVRFYKFMYTAVGEIWRWRDRIIMPEAELETAINRPETSVHVMYVHGVPAGYFELVKQGESTELAYFGLRPEYLGQGYGKHLLSMAIGRAFDDGCKRLWVHTCNLDAPGALINYKKRGFQIYDTHVEPMPQRYA